LKKENSWELQLCNATLRLVLLTAVVSGQSRAMTIAALASRLLFELPAVRPASDQADCTSGTSDAMQ
jgi:hypothetical protein